MNPKWSLDFYETFICSRICSNLNRYTISLCRTKVLWVLKSDEVGGRDFFYQNHQEYDDFYFFIQNFRFFAVVFSFLGQIFSQFFVIFLCKTLVFRKAGWYF